MRWRLANSTVVVLIPLAFLALVWRVADSPGAAPVPVPTPAEIRKAVPTADPTTTPAVGSTRSPAFVAPRLWTIGNTGDQGIAWRDGCEQTARVSAQGQAWDEGTAWGDGTLVVEVAVDEVDSCTDWHFVASSVGDRSWVRVEYLIPARLKSAEYAGALDAAGCAAESISLDPGADGLARLRITCRIVGDPLPTAALVEAMEDYAECPLESIWLGEAVATYVHGAPDMVNKEFPTVIATNSLLVVRCSTGELQSGKRP